MTFKSLYSLFILLISTLSAFAQSFSINPENIQIVRDKWGVPHIFAHTDEEGSYGLAWATCEDRFGDLQETMLSVNFRLGAYEGKDGVIRDIVAYLADVESMVDKHYEKDLSPKFRNMVSAYVKAVNKYAETYPKEVMDKKLFPLKEMDVIKGYTLSLIFMTAVHYDLVKIFKNYIDRYEKNTPKGSNAIAVSKRNTKDGKTYLALNSHQPLEGPFAWYEAHVYTDEGWNITGGTFPGGVTLFTGNNNDLGWAHTLNYPDLTDVYKLEMNPDNKLQYKYDGEWKTLEVRKGKFKVKVLGFLKIPIKRKFYMSVYGPTIKNKTGFYSMRFPAGLNCKAGEQWYRMNKAHNYNEFMDALRIQGLPGTNIVYADKEDNIYYLGNGQFPYRDKSFDWSMVLPGNTSKTLWEANKYYPIDSLAFKLNPECGFVFNTNNPPTSNSCTDEHQINCNSTFGYQTKSNNRGLRAQQLLENKPLMSYEEFKEIKYDKAYCTPLYIFAAENIELIFNLDETKYPEIAESIKVMKNWDRVADIDREGAPLMVLAVAYTKDRLFKEGKVPGSNVLDESYYVDALTYAQKYLKKHFGTVHVKLGDVQRHTRGNVNLPAYGAFDVLAAGGVNVKKNGTLRLTSGESHIQLVRFSKDGVEIESVVPYGASDNPDSPHFTDQMEMYTKGQLKHMTLDREELFQNAEKVYHPQ